MQTSINAGVTYTDTISDSGNTRGTRSQLGKISQDTGNGFSSSLGANFNFLLGEPATGNTLTALYGLAYRYPSNEDSGSSTGDGEGRLDQQLAVSGNLDLGKTTLRLDVSFADLAGPDRDSGGYAERQLFTVTTTAIYRLSAKTSLVSSLSLPYREVSGGASASGLSHTTSIDYSVDAKLQLSAGLTLGSEKVDGADDETYQRFLPRFSFQLSPKVALSGTCGLEWRQGGNGMESMEPIFDLQASWKPRLGTSFSFSFSRQVQSSVSLYGTDYVGTTLSLNAVQRLGHRMSLQLSAGFEQADYGSNPQSGGTQRQDQLYFGQVSLDLDLGRRWSAMLAYYYEENRSNSFGYTSLQAQFQLSLLF